MIILRSKKQNKFSAFLNTKKPNELLSLLTLPLAAVFWEFAVRLFVFAFPIDIGLIFVPLISFTIGAALTALILTVAVLTFGSFYTAFFSVYFNILRSIFSWQNLRFANNAISDFFSVIIDGVFANFYMIIISFLPLILFLVFRKRYFSLPEKFSISHGVTSVLSVGLAIIISLYIGFVPENRSAFLYIRNDFAKSFRYYGVCLTTGVEIAQMAFGSPEETVENPYLDPSINAGTTESTDSVAEEIVYDYHSLVIDFEALIEDAPNETIADMHKYFSTVPSTQQNEYTGYFKGKNLIFLTLEGFSYRVIDPNLTPTLYKMFNEGFKFTEYYDIMWGGSTASGEYANMTGNFYTAATCHVKSSDTLQYSALGNLFKNAGYPTFGYHNHTYTYYSRDLSHPNFGYNYKGIGNGLVLETQNCWPKSDLEMAKATISDYINSDKPFHTYYMTVSGHNNYNWNDNMMCSRHRYDLPEGFPYSENVKAYFACQLEVELMLTELVNQLEAAGKLEDTVFAMACDHYPYALTDAELAELYNIPAENIRTNFDLYCNGFILWSASMEEPIVVDTPCSSYDIVPTLANLFGIEYESKVITGKDILSPTEKIVIINDDGKGSSWNWITDKGRYNTATKEFTPAIGFDMSDEELQEYIRITNMKVRAMRKYSLALLDHDYYSYVFNTDGTPKKTIAQ